MASPYVWALSLFCLGLGCSHTPSFSYYTHPEFRELAGKGIALDPRKDMVWRIKGRDTILAPEYVTAVVQEFVARGYRMVDPAKADLWVDVIASVPERSDTGSQSTDMAPNHGHGSHGSGGGHDHSSQAHGSGSTPHSSHGGSNGDLSVIVQVLSRNDLKVVWYGEGHFPPQKGGHDHGAASDSETQVHKLMEAYPADLALPSTKGNE